MYRRAIYILILSLVCLTASATEYRRTDNGLAFSWAKTDNIAVYTASGSLMKYFVKALRTDAHYATLESGFGISDNSVYYAYSPYNANNWDKSMTELSASYTGQTQMANGSPDHLHSFDYQMACFTTASGSAAMDFTHAGAVLHFSWTTPMSVTLTKVMLRADEPLFVTEATMNLQTQQLSATAYDNVIELTLDDIRLGADRTLNAYLAVAPTDLSGKMLTAQLLTVAGDTLFATLNGTDIKAGRYYHILIGQDNILSTFTSAKNMARRSLGGAATSVAVLTACSPDFVLDETDGFTVTSTSDNPLSVSSCIRETAAGGWTCNLAGQSVSAPQRGQIYISNGKKFLKR